MGAFNPLNLIGDDDEQKKPVIARPQPSINARPIGTSTPEAGSTGDLEAKADQIPSQIGSSMRSAIQPPTPAKPSQLDTDKSELSRLQTTGSGISQIKNPYARGGLRALNTIGSIASAAVPRLRPLMSAIPGTEEHHQNLIGQQERKIGTDTGQQEKEAQTSEAQARTAKTEAETNALNNPEAKPKEEKWGEFAGFTDNDGTPLIREENSGQVVRASDKKPPTGFKAEKPEQPFQTRDINRVVNGVPHAVMVDAQTGADVKDLGQTKVPGESPADKRSAQESAQVERESRQAIRKAEQQYRGTLQSVNQVKQSIDAAKDGNGLLTSFVPTMEVLGINASNGVHRISPAEAQAAGLPGGWSERFNAWWDKASKGELSPQLQQEGKQLADLLGKTAYDRYSSVYDDESGVVKGYGGNDFDKRVPRIQPEHQQGSGGGSQPPNAPNPGFKWQGRTANGQTEWRQVPATGGVQ